MNLLILGGHLKKTEAGWAHATLGFTNAIAKCKNINVHLFVSDVDEDLLEPAIQVIKYPQPEPVKFFWRFACFKRYLQCLKVFRRQIFNNIDICYTQDHIEGLAFKKVYPNIPIISHTGAVLSFREYLEESGKGGPVLSKLNAWLTNYIELKSYKKKSWAHIVSTPIVAEIRESHFKLPAGFFHVCPFAVDHSVFSPEAATGEIRNKFNIPKDAVVLISVSRLVAWKNTAMVLNALARLNRDDVYLIVAGDGREKKNLKEKRKQLRIEKNCFFTGFTANPAPYLAESDIFILPSAIESFGIVYAEAMACGIPCIGLKNNPPEVLSSAIDVIDDGECGYCVSSENELLEKISILISDRALLKKLGKQALNVAQSRYSWSHYVDCFMKISEDVFNVRN